MLAHFLGSCSRKTPAFMNKGKIYRINQFTVAYQTLLYCLSTVAILTHSSQAQSNPPCLPGCVQLGIQRLSITPPPPPEPPPSNGFNYVVPSSQTDWNSYNSTVLSGQQVGQTFVQESSTLRLEVRKEYGGAIQIYDKVTQQNLINFFDKGRESGMSTYTGPDSFSDDAPYWRTGYNPLQAGDSGGNGARLIFQGQIDGYIYTKYQCNSWSHVDNRLLAFFYEQWVKLVDNKVYVKVRLTHQRADKTFYRAYAQEWPFMMINGAKNVRFYNGNSPFTMGQTSVSNGIERIINGDTYITHQLTPFQITEPWMGTEIGANPNGETRLIGLTGPGFHHVGYNVSAIQSQDNSESGHTITYWGHHPFVHIDSDNTWLKEYTYIVGNEREIRDFVYAQPRSTKPDFSFTKANGRNGWYIQDGGHDQKEPFQVDNWTVTFDGKADPGQPLSARGTKLMSPMGSWKASDFNTIYVKMRYSGPENSFRLAWLLGGQAPDGIDSNYPNQNAIRFPNGVRNYGAQSASFNIINDGQMHTYQINLGSNPQWKDVIQQLELAHIDGPVIQPGEVLEMVYIGANNPN